MNYIKRNSGFFQVNQEKNKTGMSEFDMKVSDRSVCDSVFFEALGYPIIRER